APATPPLSTLSLHDALPICRRQRAGAPRDTRKAEIGRHHPAALALDQDVRQREVAMNDALRVRVGERLGDRGRVGGCLAEREREDRKSTRLNSSHVAISYAV